MKQLTGLFRSDRLGRVYAGPGGEVDKFARSTDARINMAVELEKELSKSSIHVHVPDYQTPPDDQQVKYALLIATQALSDGRDVVVNCMGGIGRSGMFLSVLVGLLKPEVRNPVQFVRENCNAHAVETPEQKGWVSDFISDNQRLGSTLRMMLRRTTQRRREKQGLTLAASQVK